MTIFQSNRYPLACLLCCHLMAALTLTACKDDNNDSLTPEEQAEQAAAEQQDKAAKFWNVVDQLAGTTATPDDYEGLTLEPTIGEAVSGNETARRVVTADLEAAVQRYENLAGLPEGTLTTETPAYTWSDPDVGSLTYTKTDNSASLATVDVNIRQVPGLRQIVYLTPEQAGDNSGDYYNCYYRFGDVISRKNSSGIDELWVCVRPSFEPEKKGDSHWITLSPLPKENILEYTSSNKKTHRLPKNLGVNYEQMQNLAEMAFAMAEPGKWQTNIADNPRTSIFNKGVPMFHDFDKSKITYTSSYFWERVAQGWSDARVQISDKKTDLWFAVFGMSRTNMQDRIVLNKGALRFIHSSAKWSTWTSNSLTIYEAVYRNGAKEKSNMHEETRTSYTTQVVYKGSPSLDLKLDFVEEITADANFIVNKDFFKDDDRHYVIRHATGKELAKATNTSYSTKAPISGYEEVYNYNKKYGKLVNAKCETSDSILKEKKYSSDTPVVGYAIGKNGKFYSNFYNVQNDGTEPAAIIVYVGKKGTADTSSDEYTGLAMSLRTIGKVMLKDGVPGIDNDFCACGQIEDIEEASYVLDGVTATKQMAQGCSRNHIHPAAQQCLEFNDIDAATRKANHFSDWFIPTLGQWLLAIEGLDAKKIEKEDEWATTDQWDINMNLVNTDANTIHFDFEYNDDVYWSSTQRKGVTDNSQFVMRFFKYGGENRMKPIFKKKTETARLRPFIAF